MPSTVVDIVTALRQHRTRRLARMRVRRRVPLELELDAGQEQRQELDGNQDDGQVDTGMASAAEGGKLRRRGRGGEVSPAAAPGQQSIGGGGLGGDIIQNDGHDGRDKTDKGGGEGEGCMGVGRGQFGADLLLLASELFTGAARTRRDLQSGGGSSGRRG